MQTRGARKKAKEKHGRNQNPHYARAYLMRWTINVCCRILLASNSKEIDSELISELNPNSERRFSWTHLLERVLICFRKPTKGNEEPLSPGTLVWKVIFVFHTFSVPLCFKHRERGLITLVVFVAKVDNADTPWMTSIWRRKKVEEEQGKVKFCFSPSRFSQEISRRKRGKQKETAKKRFQLWF